MRRLRIALLALATAAAIGLMVAGPVAMAQQPATCEPTQFFGADGGILNGASGMQTLGVRACAEGTVWLSQDPAISNSAGNLAPTGDPPVIQLNFDIRPCSLPSGSDLPGATLTVSVVSLTPEAKASAVLTLAPDKEAPTLNTTSTPRKGTRVKPGDTIKIRMDASEEYTYPGRFDWQTGVKKLQLIDEGPNPVVTPHWEGDRMRACAAKQWKQFLEVTYTVPPNPPPVIRLRAVAEDFAGNKDEDVAEFPTAGDWTGSFEWTHSCQGPTLTDVTNGFADLALDHDGRGNLTGTLAGSTRSRRQAMADCTRSSVAPGTFTAKLLGSYTPTQNTFSAQAVDVQTTPGKASWTCPAGTMTVDEPFYSVYEAPIFRNAFRDLRRQPDGSLKSNGEDINSAGGTTCTTAYSLTLRRTAPVR